MKYLKTGLLQFSKVTKSSLFKASGIYTISSFANASIPFLLLPLLTKVLSQGDFGIVAMFSTVVSFIMPFVGINMEGAIARRFYTDDKQFSKYVGNCIMISIGSMLLVFIICFLFRNLISFYSSIPSSWVLLAVLLCFSQFLGLILLTIYQVNVKPLNYGVYQISQSVLNFGLSLVLILHFNMRWDGRVLAQVFTGCLFALVAIVLLLRKKYIVFEIDKSHLKHALMFGGGLIPHALGGLLIILTNRFFLLNMISIDETGLYSVAAQIGSVVGFFTISFNNAFVPWLYNNLKKENQQIKLKIVRFTYLYFVLIFFAGLLFYILAPFLFRIFINPNFYASNKYLFWIIFGFVFQGMYFMVTNYISYSEKTHYQAFVTLFVGLINIPMNYFFIKCWGAVGAGIAFCCCFFLLFICTWVLSNKVYKMPWLLKLPKF